jgi:hypothetical protein
MRLDIGNEELRVQINSLKYELESLKQERDLTALQHEKELYEAQARSDEDFKKAQVGNPGPACLFSLTGFRKLKAMATRWL